MSDAVDELVESLLFEGYALYPYTPGATKNATPTPFGIVYPPAYAAALTSTYDHLELRCVMEGAPDAVLAAEVRFLGSSGEGHRAQEQRVTLPGVMVAALPHRPATKEASSEGPGGTRLDALVTLSAEALGVRAWEVVLRVENRTDVPAGLDRGAALAHSLLSVHPVLRVSGGRFVSALEHSRASINTFPVLADPADTVMVGAAMVLPDHPQIAPESRGGLFDSTEIEEALVLHVQVLSDGERAEIEAADPAVREMVARAAAVTPEEIVRLHGRVTVRDPETVAPPVEPAGLSDPRAGEDETQIGGRRFARGDHVVLRPPPSADLQARMLEGRTARIERIFTDYDGRVHFGVTVDDDPGQDLMRDTARFLYFFAEEVEVIGS